MDKSEILKQAREHIKNLFSGEGTGHDFFHAERVVKTAKQIAEAENADLFLVELAAWLHDLGDYKLHEGVDRSEELVSEFLGKLNLPPNTIRSVNEIISQVSFTKGNRPSSLEAEIVQDADRLDAIGAIGIARCFAYGGKMQREIWNPENPEKTTIQHFYDKLLKLKSLMNTEAGRKIAENRHRILEDFLKAFYDEWEN